MRPLKAALCAAVIALVAAAAAPAARVDGAKAQAVAMELVGQVMSSPTSSTQYGYVAFLAGLPIFKAAPESESTALLTFFTDTSTVRVINNGPVRIISRTGTLTIYDDPSANGSFGSPDSFRDGTPVLVASLRQHVILNTVTNAFTAYNVNTITSTAPFEVGGQDVKLGKVGGVFRTFISGVNNAAPPPSAWMAGYTIPGPAPKAKK
jgi:hypothetical protein